MLPALFIPKSCPFLKSCQKFQLHQGPSRYLDLSNSATDSWFELQTVWSPVGQCDTTYLVLFMSQVAEHRIEKIKLKSQFCHYPAEWFGGRHWVYWKYTVSLFAKLSKQCLSFNLQISEEQEKKEIVKGVDRPYLKGTQSPLKDGQIDNGTITRAKKKMCTDSWGFTPLCQCPLCLAQCLEQRCENIVAILF